MDSTITERLTVRVDMPRARTSVSASATSEDGRSWQVPITRRLEKLMAGNSALCFSASVDGTILRLYAKAPWQSWA